MSDNGENYCPPTLVHFVAKKLGCGMNQVYSTAAKTAARKAERQELEEKYGAEYRDKRARYLRDTETKNRKRSRKEPCKPVLTVGKQIRHNKQSYAVSRIETIVTYHPVEEYYARYIADETPPRVNTIETINDDCIIRETVEEYPRRNALEDRLDADCEISSILAEFE